MRFSCEIEKTDRGVVIKPLYSSDAEELSKLKQGTTYNFSVKQDRNTAFHKKFMALLNVGYENQELFDNFDHYRKVVVMKAGFFDTIVTDKGTVYIPLSISFGSMDEIEFQELFNKVLDVIAEQLDSAPVLIKEQIRDFY